MSNKSQSGQNMSKGLGRGLDALFRNTENVANIEAQEEQQSGSLSLPVHALLPFAGQPRQHFDEEKLEELAASIKSQGLVQALIVRPVAKEDHLSGAISDKISHEIIAGERRWRAAKLAGLQVVPVVVRPLSDADAYTVALIENVQREDLNPIEEAKALHQLRVMTACSQEELASRLGKSRSNIANTLRLLQLSEPIQDSLQKGMLSAGHGRALLSLPRQDLQDLLFACILDKGLSVRDAETLLPYIKEHEALPEGFAAQSEELSTSEISENQEALAQNPQAEQAKKRNRKTKMPEIVAMQKALRKSLQGKVNVAGDKKMGRITLSYDNEEALEKLCQRLGIDYGSFFQKDSEEKNEG